jgi:hypothetical protein
MCFDNIHNQLTYLKSLLNLLRRQTQWLEYFEQFFDYKWEYCHGNNNALDPLNKNPSDQKQVTLALLAKSASSRIKQLVEAHTKLGDLIEMTNNKESPLDLTMTF